MTHHRLVMSVLASPRSGEMFIDMFCIRIFPKLSEMSDISLNFETKNLAAGL
jgi:hypothetical protein